MDGAADGLCITFRSAQAEDDGMCVWAEPPDMQVGNAFARIRDDPRYRGGVTRLGGVQQYGGRVAHQPPRPTEDYDRACDADQRIEPQPAEIAPAK